MAKHVRETVDPPVQGGSTYSYRHVLLWLVLVAAVVSALAMFAGTGCTSQQATVPAASSEPAALVKAESSSVVPEGYYQLDEALPLAGYERGSDGLWHKSIGGVEVDLRWATDEMLCYKNDYQFSLVNQVIEVPDDGLYVLDALLENITNYEFHVDETGALASNGAFDYTTGAWWSGHLIAHAGGGMRMENILDAWNNSYDTLVQNYSLGHRVFEFDFYLTSDDQLATVHDWEQFGTKDGVAHTAEEWKNDFGASRNNPENGLRTMMATDVFDQMLVNPDMYIVTDTKSYELSDEETHRQFELLCQAAEQRDASLLDRVVVQVYSAHTYDLVMDVYPFKHVIYTTYALPEPEDEVVDFVLAYDNIEVLTSNIEQERFTEDHIKRIHDAGKKWFRHTVNDYNSYTKYRYAGVDGVYTDMLLPRDVELCENIREGKLL